MADANALVSTLKRALRARGWTYQRIANALGLSEAAIKRLFSTRRFTLERLEQICALLELELSDLVELHETQRRRISHIDWAQEEELVSDLHFLLVALCVRDHWSFEQVVEAYALSVHEVVRHLARLDRIGLIDLLPGNRIRLRVAEDFRWLPGGPIEQFFRKHVQREFLAAGFGRSGELYRFLSANLSSASRERVLARLEDLALEFGQLMKRDSALPPAQRDNVGLLIALRPLELTAFKRLRRSASER